jgi:arylsulfatase B
MTRHHEWASSSIAVRGILFGALFAMFAMWCSVASASSTAPTPRTQPNVVIMLADDLGWADVGFHGGQIETPSVDSLARDGVQLDRFYVAPICSPTRAAIMTGRDPLKLGIGYDQIHPWYNAGLAPDETTIAETFRAGGYQTGMVGKWHLGHTQEHQLPNAHGFEHFYGHLHTNTDFFGHKREGAHDLQQNGKSVFEPGKYLTHIEAREAVRFIRERDPDKPFFLYVPFTAPHSPMQAPPEVIEKYASLPAGKYRREYAAMVDQVDVAVGEILAEIERAGLSDDTIVIFLSDNGGSNPFGGQNQPLRGHKGETFEGGIRVPAVMRWPGVLKAGEKFEQVTSGMDLLPTLAAAAQVSLKTTRALDGQDMWSALRDGKVVPRAKPLYFVSEIPLPGYIQVGVIDGEMKLVQKIFEGQTETRVQTYLFDLDADPYEQIDLAKSRPEEAARLATRIREWRSQHPMAGTRGTLVAHPGWVAPYDWADAVVPNAKLQPNWKNELPFSADLLKATESRGVLVDEATRKQLIDAEQDRRTQGR